MKNLYVLFYMLISFFSYSQIGIGTSYPQGILHVDGAKDNPVSEDPTPVQQMNDFIITTFGNVGIGNTEPQRKLDANAGAQSLRIQNLIREVPDDHDILIINDESGDVTTAKYSYSINSASIASGGTRAVTIPSKVNIPAGMLIVRSRNGCGRTMISTYMYSDISLGYLSAVARDKVGVVTSSAGVVGTSANWKVKFANIIKCGDGGGLNQFDYTIVKTGISTYTITNDGNIARIYTLTFFRL